LFDFSLLGMIKSKFKQDVVKEEVLKEQFGNRT
jgi:hypothetical protein